MDALSPSTDVIAAFFAERCEVSPIVSGHINSTFLLKNSQGAFVLQRLNPIFAAEVNADIAALVPRLRAGGLRAPDVLPCRDGALWHTDAAGGVWRMLSHIEGVTYLRAEQPQTCYAAGVLLGQFHRALAGVHHQFAAQRLGVHDTARHLQGLRDALRTHTQHPAFAEVEPMAKDVLQMAASLPQMPACPQRIVHGDPKLSNFLFADAHTAVALIDLDTLGYMEIALELGDALRSWCNPAGEGPLQARFIPEFFVAAVKGYAEGSRGLLQPQEVQQIAAATQRITLELTARFLRDALEERYFSWDRDTYQAAWQHHLVRSRSQWHLAQAFVGEMDWANKCVADAFGLTT